MAGKRSNREGSIYFRASDSKWVAALTLIDGRRKVLYGATQEEARRKLAKAIYDRDQGLHSVTDGRQTVQRYLSDWLLAMRTRVRESTWISYEHRLRLYVIAAIGNKTLIKLLPGDLSRLYADLIDTRRLSPSTVLKTHGIIHHALKEAVRANLVARNIAELVDPPRALKRAVTVYTPDEVNTLLSAIEGHKHETLYTLALTSGMRLGELLALKWRDVDLAGRFLSVREGRTRTLKGWADGLPKTDSGRRRIKLTADAAASLQAHRARQLEHKLWLGAAWKDLDLVFPSEIGTPGDHSNVLHAFHKVTDRAHLPRLRVHDLRHTAATLLLLKGVPPKIVSKMLGHASVAITLDLYSHVLPEMQDMAVAAMESVFADRKKRKR